MRLGETVKYNPGELGINALALSATRTSNAFGLDGCNNIAIKYKYTRSAGSLLTFDLQCSTDGFVSDSSNVATISQNLGTSTVYAQTFSIATNASVNNTIFIPLIGAVPSGVGLTFRLANITCTSGAAGDLLTMEIFAGLVP